MCFSFFPFFLFPLYQTPPKTFLFYSPSLPPHPTPKKKNSDFYLLILKINSSRCHDLSPTNLDQHPNEHATRMLCGLCSREQAYHPSTCRHCHANLVGNKSGNGFWEGGKGTRDRVKMNRKGKYLFFSPSPLPLSLSLSLTPFFFSFSSSFFFQYK